jgi:putative membrane protein
MRWAWIGVGAFILVLGSILFFGSMMRFGLFSRGFYGMPMMGGGGFAFGILGLIFLCFIGFMAVRFLIWGSMGRRSVYRWGGDDAEEILRQRFARGEISKEQFEQMLHDLREARN